MPNKIDIPLIPDNADLYWPGSINPETKRFWLFPYLPSVFGVNGVRIEDLRGDWANCFAACMHAAWWQKAKDAHNLKKSKQYIQNAEAWMLWADEHWEEPYGQSIGDTNAS